MRSERIDMRVTPQEKAEWESEGKKLGLDLSALIRRAVQQYLAEHAKLAA